MDPNLFRIDWDRLAEVLTVVIVLAFLLERALALIFEHRLFVARFDQKGLKEPIAFLVALLVCWRWDFDAVSSILLTEKTTVLGKVITAGVIAGGSKASVKLFRGMMGAKSQAYAAMEKARAAAPPNLPAAPPGR